MRVFLTIILFLLGTNAKTQTPDSTYSTWFESKYFPRFIVDTGTYLPPATFIDKNGHKKTLADFKGKILYVGIWAALCGNSTAEFAYQEQLLKRLKDIHIDTAF